MLRSQQDHRRGAPHVGIVQAGARAIPPQARGSCHRDQAGKRGYGRFVWEQNLVSFLHSVQG